MEPINNLKKTDSEFSLSELMKLHDNIEDNCLNKCIRIGSSKSSDLFYNELYKLIMSLKRRLNMNLLELSNYLSDKLCLDITPSTLYGWMGGRFSGKNRSIPLNVLNFLIKDYCFDNKKYILKEWKNINNFADGIIVRSGAKLNMIKELDENLCYFVGLIVGDGSCPNTFADKNKTKKEYKITLALKNKKFGDKIAIRINFLFGINIKPVRIERDNIWNISFKSKYIFRLLTNIFEIPRGKKSLIVYMPKIIKNSNKAYINSFIRGVIDTDGCVYIHKVKDRKDKYLKYLKITVRMRSKALIKDIAEELKKQDYRVKEFSYMGNSFNKKFKVKFYGFYLHNKEAKRYAKEIGFLNPHKIRVIQKFFQSKSFALKKGRLYLGYVSSPGLQ